MVTNAREIVERMFDVIDGLGPTTRRLARRMW